ncbi:MAG: hypothetical protein KAI53_05325, partial [Candidatus Aenigmarchaeota archaeon]|nr:hypothetical protein [Candidatus Aenigmarchaeota archaeon]
MYSNEGNRYTFWFLHGINPESAEKIYGSSKTVRANGSSYLENIGDTGEVDILMIVDDTQENKSEIGAFEKVYLELLGSISKKGYASGIIDEVQKGKMVSSFTDQEPVYSLILSKTEAPLKKLKKKSVVLGDSETIKDKLMSFLSEHFSDGCFTSVEVKQEYDKIYSEEQIN